MNDVEQLSYLLACSRRAFLGQISPPMRRIDLALEGHLIRITCLVDGEPDEDLKDLMYGAAADLISDYPEDFDFDVEFIRADFPARMPRPKGTPIYQRHEPS